MTNLKNTLIATLLTLTLSGCAATFEATHDHDPAADFASYKTFSWISKNPMTVVEGSPTVNPLLEPRITSALENGLTAKGYEYVIQPENADFVLAFTVGSREKIKVNSYPSTYAGYGGAYPSHWGWGGRYYGGVGYSETQVRQYTKGMLAVDIFDVKARKPVWHSVAEKTINDSDRENLNETVQAAVDAILEGFPPQ